MKRHFILLTLVIISGIWLLLAIAPNKGEQVQQVQDVQSEGIYKEVLRPDINFGKIPLYFVANQGQVNEKTLFYAKASRYTLWITKHGLIFDSTKRTVKGNTKLRRDQYRNRAETKQIQNSNVQNSKQKQNSLEYSPLTKYQRDVSRFMFIAANKNPELVPVDEAKLRVNYFKGKDKSQWHCDIPTSQAVLYKGLYKNIDLKVYGIEKEIEYDWIVKPGGDPEDIKFEYKDVKGTRLDEEGNLLIETDFGELIHKKPVAYQQRGQRIASQAVGRVQEAAYVEVKFKKIADNTYGFEVGEYDKSRELIIDPVVLAYSTYLGGSNYDRGDGIVVDGSGCAYVTGFTESSDFPTLNGYHSNFRGNYDVFITKLDTTKSGASSLIYSTYLGGNDYEWGRGIAVDGSGCVYVTGFTQSSNFPTLNECQTYLGGIYDAFVTKLDTTKSGVSSLIYSTYLGFSDHDYSYGIAVDGSGCAYVTGTTKSSYFPTLSQYQAYHGGWDAFLTKLDTTKSGASSLLYSTYLGGSNYESGYGIAVDGSGCAYVIGETYSLDFPTLNGYQAYQGSRDAFITKLDTTKKGSSSLVYSTYLGGRREDRGRGIAVDGSGCAYVTGYTESSNFPTLNEYQAYLGRDSFITKLDTTKNGSSSFIYSTCLGGKGSDYGYGIAVDGSGCAYVTGETYSSDFPILNGYQTKLRGYVDAFLTLVDTTKNGASSLFCSTYLGGDDHDHGYGIAVDGSGCAYVTGTTDSRDFPTLNEYQANLRGEYDVFITKLVLFTEMPSIQLNRTSLYFGAISGSSQTGSQTVSVGISGGCSMHWIASSDEKWIQVTPKSATGSALVTVSVDTAGLAPGTYTGTVSITYASASNSISVNLTIYDAASTRVPFGDFSTPLDASVARGSIPVTGWVLDDIQVESVKIYRDASIYVGDAVLVDGARPDVEAAFPNYPFNYRAGWGYMLLTNFFPNGGNGVFTLSAVAADIEGNQVTLGSKTIICDNANAVKPFGAIDTPAQGATASGSGYINYGWVLTPLPNAIPTDGSTIHVYVDGVNLGNPTYNNYRADIAALFPGYANSNGAVGYFILNTTAYTNGTHTIYWTAEDDAGNKDGIGSRYFNIQNSGSPARMFNVQVQGLLSDVEPGQLPVDYSNPVTVKKGFGRNIEPQKFYADDNGIITVETRELERVVLHLDGDRIPSMDSTTSLRPVPVSHVPRIDSYIFLNTGGGLRPLPIGSTFDAERNILYWQPGPGFIGQYNFVFIKKGPDGEWQKKIIKVVIHPSL